MIQQQYKSILNVLAGEFGALAPVSFDDPDEVRAVLDKIETEIKYKVDHQHADVDMAKSMERVRLVREALDALEAPNAYEAKLEAKRDRLEERAEKAQDEAAARYERVRKIADAIPLGQPILVGHHSERRARRDAKRIHDGMAKSLELADRARDLERRAAAIGSAGVSSDDPQAILKLKLKLEATEIRRELEKQANAAMRKAAKAFEKKEGRKATQEDHIALALKLEVPGDIRVELISYARAFPWVPQFTSNTGAECRRLAARIEELEARAAEPERAPIDGDGWTIEDNARENRIQISFKGKPEEPVRAALKSAGFRWAPSVGVWQRQRNNGAWAAAKRAMGVQP